MAALLQAATGINGGDDILSKMSSRSVFPALSSERKNSPYMLRVLRSGPDIPGLPRSEDLIRKASCPATRYRFHNLQNAV